MSSETGPSWFDLSVQVETLTDQYRCSIELLINRPYKRRDGRGYSAFAACVRASIHVGDKVVTRSFNRPWGQGGASKTCPQAFYLAVLDTENWLEELDIMAKRSATF